MIKKCSLIFSILFLFTGYSAKAAILSKQECADRVEQFRKSEKTVELYLKDLQNDLNNFTNEVQNIVTHAKTGVERIGGHAQVQYYKEFSALRENLNNKIRDFNFILDEHIFSILLIEDCFFNQLLTHEKYETLFQLNREEEE